MTKLGQILGENHDDNRVAREYVTSAYAMMAVLATLGLVSVWGTAPFVDWPGIVGARPGQIDWYIEPIVLATLSAFIVNIFASLIVRVQYGLQQMAQSNLWQTVGSLSTLAATWLAALVDPGPGWFVAIAAFSPVTVSALNTVVFFTRSNLGRTIAPKLSLFRLSILRKLAGLGSKYLLISVLMTVSITLDPWIVARTAGLADVPSYWIPFRVFAVIGTVSAMLTTPLWPMHAQAVISGDLAWIRRITRRMTAATVSATVAASLLAVLFGPQFLALWLGKSADPATILWLALGVWWVVQSLTGPAFMVQNGAEVLWPQTLGYVLFLIALPLKWWVSLRFGYEWIPLVGAGLYATIIWPSCWYGYRLSLVRAQAGKDQG